MKKEMKEVELIFFRGRRGDIVSRLPGGKICLVDKKSSRKPQSGEKWICKIKFERDNFAVVTLIAKIVTKKRQVIIKRECGHEEIEYEEIEIREDKEPETRVFESSMPCKRCSEKWKKEQERIDKIREEVREEVWKIIENDQEIKKINKKLAKIGREIRELIEFIRTEPRKAEIKLESETIYPIPGSTTREVRKKYFNPTCLCGEKLEVVEEDGFVIRSSVTCKCGREFKVKGIFDDELEKTVGYYLLDVKLAERISEEIRKAEERIKELREVNDRLCKEEWLRKREIIKKILKERYNIEITKVDIDEQGYGRIYTNRGTFIVDEGLVFPEFESDDKEEMIKVTTILEMFA